MKSERVRWAAEKSIFLGLFQIVTIPTTAILVNYFPYPLMEDLFYWSVTLGAVMALGAVVLGHYAHFRVWRSGISLPLAWRVWVGPLLGYGWFLATAFGVNCVAITFRYLPQGTAMRASQDLVWCGKALEAYLADHGAYPPAMDLSGNLIPIHEGSVSVGYLPWVLSTPIAYVDWVGGDRCVHQYRWSGGLFNASTHYLYATDGERRWVVSSHGPDRDDDVGLELSLLEGKGLGTWEEVSRRIDPEGPTRYDPTNGVESSGDIFLLGPEKNVDAP